ncbi:PD-(D/E)XK nuclease family protein, partial [Eggerthella sinensis]|uniref:PD-(D/E)XK nuclease family protein n=1 Tax=Eggerthella sinensis TaxID=242230 RepID=UPI0022E8555B
ARGLPSAGAPLALSPSALESYLECPSPSALESYLECPYKWFALRRLRLSEPDAGFGPLEMGSFSHGVLKSFYEHFQAAGHAKVQPATLGEARVLLRETFERHLAFQPELKHSCNPLIPRTSFERAETNDLEKKLVAFLDREAALLPGFAPRYFEFDFGSAADFPYAGCLLRGSVDRIDVNERGQAVVIDYKARSATTTPWTPRRRRRRPGAPCCPTRCRRSCTPRWRAGCSGSRRGRALRVVRARPPRGGRVRPRRGGGA